MVGENLAHLDASPKIRWAGGQESGGLRSQARGNQTKETKPPRCLNQKHRTPGQVRGRHWTG